MEVWHIVILIAAIVSPLVAIAFAIWRSTKKPERFYSMGTFDD